MILPEITNELIKELTTSELKNAARNYGLSHYYFKQKVQSVETSNKELFKAMQCMMEIINQKQERINSIYEKFLKEYENEE